MLLAYVFAGAHVLLLLRWRTIPVWFRAAALFWALQALNRVAYGDNSDVETWMRLERCVLALMICATVELALSLRLAAPVWSFQVRIGVLMGGFAFGCAMLYYMREVAEFDPLAKFIFLRAKIQAGAAFLATAAALVGWMAGVRGGHAYRFALAAYIAVPMVANQLWTTPDEWRMAQTVGRGTMIGCCLVWLLAQPLERRVEGQE